MRNAQISAEKWLIVPFFLTFLFFINIANASEVPSNWINETLRLYENEELKLGNYSLKYVSAITSDSFVEFLYVLNISNPEKRVIVKYFERDEIYKARGIIQYINNRSFIFRINRIDYYAGKGTYLELTVWSPYDVFAVSSLNTTAPSAILASPGDKLSIPLTLSNTGVVDDVFNLTFVSDAPLDVSFEYNGYKIRSLPLKKGEVANLLATVTIPETTPSGKYDVSFIAEGRSKAHLNLTIEVVSAPAEYVINLGLSELYTQINSGEEGSITARVSNDGDSTVTNVQLSVDVPEGWGCEIHPKTISKINPKEYRDFTITIKVPPRAKVGDYFVKIHASSDQTESDEITLRVNVKERGVIGYVGLFIAVISVIALFIIFKIFGRR